MTCVPILAVYMYKSWSLCKVDNAPTKLSYKVSSQEARAPKYSRNMSCNGAVSRRTIRNDWFFGRERNEVVVSPLEDRYRSERCSAGQVGRIPFLSSLPHAASAEGWVQRLSSPTSPSDVVGMNANGSVNGGNNSDLDAGRGKIPFSTVSPNFLHLLSYHGSRQN
jgi:hypothetical protein